MSIQYLAAGRALAVLLREPTDFRASIQLADALAEWGARRRARPRMLEGLSAEEIAHLRELTLRPLDLDALLALPGSSFGHQYAALLRARGIDPDALVAVHPPIARAFERDWMLLRLVRTHDVHHMLLGWGFDYSSEMGLQVFNYRNFHEPYGLVALLGVPFALALVRERGRLLREVARGWTIGPRLPNLFSAPFEDMYPLDLEVVRRRLGIDAVTTPAG